MAQLSDALLYCQARKIIHRDIKPEDIMLGASGDIKIRLKIEDFGLSVDSSSLRYSFCNVSH